MRAGRNDGVLLFNEPPISISPTLCRLISLQAAVLLQQVHFWLQHKAAAPDKYRNDFIDGRYWVYWTYEQLQKAIPLGRSIEPHKRVIKELNSLGILLVAQHRAFEWDRTNFYSIDYHRFQEYVDSLHEIEGFSSKGNPAGREEGSELIDAREVSPSFSAVPADYKQTEKTTENSSKNTTTTVVVGADIPLQVIHLLPEAKRYRPLIERSISGLNHILAQEVADEVGGTICAINLKQREPVQSYARWIPALAESARKGTLVPQYGPGVARMRDAKELKGRQEQKISRKSEEAAIRMSKDTEMATAILESLNDSDLALVSKAAAEKCLFRTMRVGISNDILARRLPKGPGRSEAVEVLTNYSCGGGS